MDPKERFYRQFHDEVQAVQDRITSLGSISTVGGERQDAKDSILASISALSLEVADASDYIPAYDQRSYAESIKGLTEKLNEELARLTPKARFQFKKTAKTAATGPAGTADTSQPADPRILRGAPRTAVSSAPPGQTAPQPSGKDYNAEMTAQEDAHADSDSIRKPSFSSAREVAISNHKGLHIILPPSASRATSSGSLTSLRRCVVDMSVPTGALSSTDAGGSAFLSLMLQDMDCCLIIAGRVNGPVHITGLRDCVVVVAARQVRIHECRHVDLYLHCGSRPIIEDCTGMRFAPLPRAYHALQASQTTDKDDETQTSNNQWNQVDDFKWLKADHSPNWSILPESERLPETTWTGPVAGEPGKSTDDVLRAVGILPR